jgi:hypothetical protein
VTRADEERIEDILDAEIIGESARCHWATDAAGA